MEVWDLLRPSFRRVMVLVAVGLLAAVAAVGVEHRKADTVQVDARAFFAQALGLDTTSFSVDPTAAQLVSVLSLPTVQQSAAGAAKVPLSIVQGATVTHDPGSPVIDVTATSTDAERARVAASALVFAGLAYLTQQDVSHAESVQASSIAALAATNTQLAAYRAKTGIADVDSAVAKATAAVDAASGGPPTKLAEAQLAALQALQPQYDALTSQVAGAQSAVSTAYATVSAARSAAAAAKLPDNVVTAPAAPVSRLSAYLRAAVGAILVVVVLGMAVFLISDVRRRQRDERRGVEAPRAADRPSTDPDLGVATGSRSVGPPPSVSSPIEPTPADPTAAEPDPPVTTSPQPSVIAPDRAADGPPSSASSPQEPRTTNPYLTQAARFVQEQQRRVDTALHEKDEENHRRALRDALQRVERTADEPSAEFAQPTVPDDEAAGADSATGAKPMAVVHSLFGERARAQIRVMKAVPDTADDGPDGRANTGR